MPGFRYQGFTQKGKAVRGVVEAGDVRQAREILASQGVLPEDVQAVGRARKSRASTGETRSELYRELAALIEGGQPLDAALDLLVQEEAAGMQELAALRDRVRSGDSLAEAIPTVLGASAFEEGVLSAGERAGQVAHSLGRLADFLEEEMRLKEKLRGALAYPLFVLGLALIVSAVVLLGMVPNFQKLLLEADVDTPWITTALIRVGEGARVLVVPLLVGAISFGLWFRHRLRNSRAARVGLERRFRGMPGVGAAWRDLCGVRFCRTLALLLDGGVDLPEAVESAARATGSPCAEDALFPAAREIREGGAPARALGRVSVLPEGLGAWLLAGESGGSLPAMLDQAAARFQRSWDRRVGRIVRWIEPVTIILVGLFVLMVALAVLLPILSLNDTLTGG